jgi:UDP-N-acetylglucosamine acyltransferase
MSQIHPTAIVDPSARVAEDATIGPYCIIGANVQIGSGTVLQHHVCVEPLTQIGRENTIYPFAVIGAEPQDRKYQREQTCCVIGDRNLIREHVTVHRGTRNGGGITRIGNDNLLMVGVHVAHDCCIENGAVIANQVMLAGHVRVEDGANIGGGAGIHHFTTIGTCSFIAGLARIARDVPPFMIVEGNPAEVRAVNTIAMSRRGYPPEHIDAVKEAFRRLFRTNGAAISRKIDPLSRDYADVPAVQRLCVALSAAADGVHGRAREVFRHDNKRTPVPVMIPGRRELSLGGRRDRQHAR